MNSDRCDEDVYKNGKVVFVTSTIPTDELNKWVSRVARLSGQKVDWHWMAGRAVVLALGDLVKVKAALREMMHMHDSMYVKACSGFNHLATQLLDDLRADHPGASTEIKVPHWWPDGDGKDIPSDTVRQAEYEATLPPKPEDTRLQRTFACVEATGYESLSLWQHHSSQSDRPKGYKPHQWVQDSLGFLQTVGTLADMPVAVSVFWATVDGKLVLFYEATSRVVDHEMVDEWIKKNTPTAVIRTNAMNFHNVLGAIEHANKKR